MARYKVDRQKWDHFCNNRMTEMEVNFSNLTMEDKTNVFISFLSDLYDKGQRGIQITSKVSTIRQSYLIEGADISFLIGPKISQAIKSCRYTTKEIHSELNKRIYQQRLPFTLDMVMRARQLLWDSTKWDRIAADKKAIYLCIALAYDTGRRISNFTHAQKGCEDHCIKMGHVHFVFDPDGVTIPGGPSFHAYVLENKKKWDTVSSILFYFFSQKEKCKQVITSCKPIVITRSNPGQEQLITDLCQWCICSRNDSEEELLTRNVEDNEPKRRLIRTSVSTVQSRELPKNLEFIRIE